jgi:hypothetical protein
MQIFRIRIQDKHPGDEQHSRIYSSFYFLRQKMCFNDRPYTPIVLFQIVVVSNIASILAQKKYLTINFKTIISLPMTPLKWIPMEH